MRRTRRSQRGFTLLELLFVVALAAIFAAIAVPNLQAVGEAYRLSTAASAIASKLAEARTNALKRNRLTWVLVDGAARRVQVQTAAASGAATDIGGPENLPSGVVFSIEESTASVTFDALGRPLDPPQSIQLHSPASGLARTIAVTSTGRITVN